MAKSTQRRTILVADDDGEDCMLVGEALREAGGTCDLHFVRNGEELFDYLRHQGEYQEARSAPPPDLILLDLKMPGKDGRETLQELKLDPHWKRIPVVALTTSTSGDDVDFCYRMGVNTYVAKPTSFRKLVELLKTLTHYWFEVAELPPKMSYRGKTH